jgi:hypothetical protein
MGLKFRHIILLLPIVHFQPAFSQNSTIQLIESSTKKSLPYANVALYRLDGEFLK